MNTRQQTITLPKVEFIKLKQQAQAYQKFVSRVFELPLRDKVDEIVEDFRSTSLYTEGFLKDLDEGLRKSSYVK